MSFICCSFRWPYHAKVIKTLEMTSSRTVYNAFIIYELKSLELFEYDIGGNLVDDALDNSVNLGV